MRRKLDLICKDGHISTNQIVTEDIFLCPTCGLEAETYWSGVKSLMNSDDIPGGLEVKHGICWPDGTPRKYYSKSEIRSAAAEAGLSISGETPKLKSHVEDRKWREAERSKRSFI